MSRREQHMPGLGDAEVCSTYQIAWADMKQKDNEIRKLDIEQATPPNGVEVVLIGAQVARLGKSPSNMCGGLSRRCGNDIDLHGHVCYSDTQGSGRARQRVIDS